MHDSCKCIRTRLLGPRATARQVSGRGLFEAFSGSALEGAEEARLGNIQLLKGIKQDGLGLFAEGGALGPGGAHQLGTLVHDEKDVDKGGTALAKNVKHRATPARNPDCSSSSFDRRSGMAPGQRSALRSSTLLPEPCPDNYPRPTI